MNAQTKEMPRQKDIHLTIKGIDGVEKEYILVALKRKEAAFVAHTVLSTVTSALAEVGGADAADKSEALLKAIRALDFDTFWSLATIILRNVVVNGVEYVDIEDTDYFVENIDELYIATVQGVLANYPKVFTKVREALKGFDLAGKVADLVLSTPSVEV